MGTLENYFANNYIEYNNKNINKCISSAVLDEKECSLEPVDTYLEVNEKLFKQISVYKRSHEKLKEVMHKLYTCPLVTNVEKEDFKKGFKELSEPGKEIRFITLLNRYVELIREEYKLYKERFIDLKKQTYKGPFMNAGIFKSPDEKYLLGLIITELKPKYRDNYPLLTLNKDVSKQVGLTYSSARTGNLIYGIGFKGKDVTTDNAILMNNEFKEENMNKFFPFEGQKTPEEQQNTTGKALAKTIESFINIPKKRKGIVYVILIAVLVFLYFKLRK